MNMNKNDTQDANQKVVQELQQQASDLEIPCVLAFEVAEQNGVAPRAVGDHLDKLKISIIKCQLGLFGYKPQKKIAKPLESISPEIEQGIRSKSMNDRLSCSEAWDLAKLHAIPKLQLANACETLGIKIIKCQLGAF
jgi:hypothetical protein